MRLDDAPGGALELSTFILPLADSEMYNGVRAILQSKEKAAPLKVPGLSPEPVMQLSLNLSDESWVSLSGTLHEMFSPSTRASAPRSSTSWDRACTWRFRIPIRSSRSARPICSARSAPRRSVRPPA